MFVRVRALFVRVRALFARCSYAVRTLFVRVRTSANSPANYAARESPGKFTESKFRAPKASYTVKWCHTLIVLNFHFYIVPQRGVAKRCTMQWRSPLHLLYQKSSYFYISTTSCTMQWRVSAPASSSSSAIDPSISQFPAII